MVGPAVSGSDGANDRDISVQSEGTGDAVWGAFGHLLAGMLLYGGLGWLVGVLTGYVTLFVVVGLILGIGLGTTLVLLRYNKHASSFSPVGGARSSDRLREAGTSGPDRHVN